MQLCLWRSRCIGSFTPPRKRHYLDGSICLSKFPKYTSAPVLPSQMSKSQMLCALIPSEMLAHLSLITICMFFCVFGTESPVKHGQRHITNVICKYDDLLLSSNLANDKSFFFFFFLLAHKVWSTVPTMPLLVALVFIHCLNLYVSSLEHLHWFTLFSPHTPMGER